MRFTKYCIALHGVIFNFLKATKIEMAIINSVDSELERAIKNWLATSGCTDIEHIKDTPARFVKALRDSVAGYQVDPGEFLRKRFTNKTYDEMVIVRNIRVISRCAHHGERIIGKAHFAYLPDRHVVGLSKIPRMIKAYCDRLQIQEQLTEEIVDCFDDIVKPKGVGVQIHAYHFCMLARGVFEPQSDTITTALRGVFKQPAVKAEFLSSLPKDGIFP